MNSLTTRAAFGLLLIPGAALNVTDLKANEKKQDSPNVILIVTDDLGYGDPGCYGQEILTTPNIDKLAEKGMRFTEMYAGSAVCGPSRASLLTGKHTGYTDIRSNRQEQLLSDDAYTLGHMFQDAGYATGVIGKWGLGHPPPLDDPKVRGFDYHYGYVNMFHAHNYFPEFLYTNARKINLSNKSMKIDGVNPWADGSDEGMGIAKIRLEYSHDLIHNEAIEYIQDNKDNPFFLYLTYTIPHANNEGEHYNGDGMEVPLEAYNEFSDTNWPLPERGFAAMMRKLDNSVGEIMEKLKELGIEDNTLVVFTSDNGGHGQGGHQIDFFKSNGNLRGGKGQLYEGGIKIPFIAVWPGKIPSGTICDEPFAFWDFMPTFGEIIEEKSPKDINGISFLPSLMGKEQKEKHDYLYFEHYNWNFERHGAWQAVRKGDWKALKLNVNASARDVVYELYNLANDPEETTNVADQHPEVMEEMEELFLTSRTEFPILPLYE